MFMRSKIPSRFMTVTLLSLFALIFFTLSDDSFARNMDRRGGNTAESAVDRRGGNTAESPMDRRGGNIPRVKRQDNYSSQRQSIRKIVRSPRTIRHGHVVPSLPRGYRRIWRNKEPYYYYRGAFYRPARSGFIVVGAPLGAIVLSLPAGYQRIWVDDGWYYVYGDVFYRRRPSGYVVVEAPRDIIIEEPPELVQPPETDSGEVSVIASVLNVRSGPGLSYPVIYQIHEGYILDVHGKTTGWLYVELPNGEFGWVMNIYTNRLLPPGSG